MPRQTERGIGNSQDFLATGELNRGQECQDCDCLPNGKSREAIHEHCEAAEIQLAALRDDLLEVRDAFCRSEIGDLRIRSSVNRVRPWEPFKDEANNSVGLENTSFANETIGRLSLPF
jgi:hypothetical protein